MAFRLTKDLLAIGLTGVFLLWVIATAFAPMLLHVQIYNDKGQTLVMLDAFSAVFCFLGYALIGRTLPGGIVPESR